MSETGTKAQPLVSVTDLHTFYGKSHILDGVSLHVGHGEVVGLLGRNGVGKSTTLKTIMGLVTAAEGKIFYSKGKASSACRRISSRAWASATCRKTAVSSACSP